MIRHSPLAAPSGCPIADGIALGSDPCIVLIFRELSAGDRRLVEISKRTGFDPQCVATRLRRLEASGMIHGYLDSSALKRRIFSLTVKGRAFHPVMDAIQGWQQRWGDSVAA